MQDIDNLTKCSIDSLKLRLPIGVLDSYNKDMDDIIIQTSKATAEIEREFKVNSINFLSPKLNNEILINSKQLEHRYFEGITLSNICVIYNMIIELGIIKCSFKTFMDESLITDCDFKKDFYLELPDYKEMVNGCDEMTKFSKKKHGGHETLKKTWAIQVSMKLLNL